MAHPAIEAMEDEEILRGLQDRDPELLDRLIEDHGACLFRYLLRVTGNYHTAEDLLQETWLRVLERGHQYSGASSFRAWLFGIARHLAIDLSRREKPAASLDEMASAETGFQPAAPPADSPYAILCRLDMRRHLALQVRRLPQKQQEVFWLRAGQDLLLAAIAAETSTPLNTVKHYLYQAVATLREHFAQPRWGPLLAGDACS